MIPAIRHSRKGKTTESKKTSGARGSGGREVNKGSTRDFYGFS